MNPNFNTDKAWDVLYTRLREEELLLPDTKKAISGKFFYYRVAAIITGIIIGCGIIFWQIQTPHKSQWLTQQNPDSKSTLVTLLEDGSVVYLAGNASLSYPEKFDPDKREVRMKGEALLDISPEAGRPFYVETKYVTVEVLGTAFRIQSSEEQQLFSLSVERGKVKVTRKETGEQFIATTGEEVLLQPGTWQKTRIEDGTAIDKLMEKISFKDERLEDIVRVINTFTDQPIVLEAGLENRILTVAFDEHSAGSMAQLICLALKLNCREQQDSIFISR